MVCQGWQDGVLGWQRYKKLLTVWTPPVVFFCPSPIFFPVRMLFCTFCLFLTIFAVLAICALFCAFSHFFAQIFWAEGWVVRCCNGGWQDRVPGVARWCPGGGKMLSRWWQDGVPAWARLCPGGGKMRCQALGRFSHMVCSYLTLSQNENFKEIRLRLNFTSAILFSTHRSDLQQPWSLSLLVSESLLPVNFKKGCW